MFNFFNTVVVFFNIDIICYLFLKIIQIIINLKYNKILFYKLYIQEIFILKFLKKFPKKLTTILKNVIIKFIFVSYTSEFLLSNIFVYSYLIQIIIELTKFNIRSKFVFMGNPSFIKYLLFGFGLFEHVSYSISRISS